MIYFILYFIIGMWMFYRDNYKDIFQKTLIDMCREKFGEEFANNLTTISNDPRLCDSRLVLVGRVLSALTWPATLFVLLIFWVVSRLHLH